MGGTRGEGRGDAAEIVLQCGEKAQRALLGVNGGRRLFARSSVLGVPGGYVRGNERFLVKFFVCFCSGNRD